MITQKSVLVFFNLFIALSFFILFTVIAFRKNNSISNFILAFILLIPTITIINNLFLYFSVSHHLIYLYYIGASFNLLFGPAVLLYLYSQQGRKPLFTNKLALHIVPTVIFIGASVPITFISDSEKDVLFLKFLKGEDSLANCLYMALLFHIITYLIWAKLNLTSYKKSVETYFSSQDELAIKWMDYFLNSFIALNIFMIILYTIQMSAFPSMSFYTDMVVTPLSAFIFYLAIIYKSYSFHSIINKEQFQKLIKLNKPITEQIIVAPEKEIRPKQLEQYKQIKNKLEPLLRSEKIYLNSGLNLQQTADTIGCGRTLLSQTINTQYNMTFFDLINSYRVKEAEHLLCNSMYKHLKIESLGELAGFSSRASFFSIFKKYTGFSPAEFKDMHSKK